MFARHQQEREKLLKWEENHRGGVVVKRTSSMETIKGLTDAATESDAESVVSEEPMKIEIEQDDPFSDSNSPGKGNRKLSSRNDDESLTYLEMSDADDASSDITPYTLNKPGTSCWRRMVHLVLHSAITPPHQVYLPVIQRCPFRMSRNGNGWSRKPLWQRDGLRMTRVIGSRNIGLTQK